jgi:hypothetical protein
MKIDTSILQAGALTVAGAISVIAAVQGNWSVVGAALTGFFAVINIHPRTPSDPQP